jgi:hypothetical protein
VSTRCLGCDGRNLRLVYHLAERGDARIVACEAWNPIQLEGLPSPEGLHELYAEGYFEGVGSDAGYAPGTIARLLEGAGLEVVAVDPPYQYYRLPFLMSKIRELVDPLGRLVPGFEHWASLRERMLRVTSGSMRVIARRPGDIDRGKC